MMPHIETDEELLISADSGYAHRCKQMLNLIKNLRAIGAQADLDLPRIAVIGNQSAGKSSLVEAISGITVPRDAGTCTRCPMECRLSASSGTWSCQISIRWEFHDDGHRRDEVHEVPFGTLLTDKGDVELALRRAQAAVLHPSVPSVHFASMTAEELKQLGKDGVQGQKTLEFSRNVVCVDLAGPELTDLSFVDLPGIISNAEPQVVKFVEGLVRSHIKGNCLILVCLPMSDDIDNQKAARLAREEDPSGLRTIGVLTKPDTLAPGASKSRELWLDVIEGRRHVLTHGYYCTRQPDDDERLRGITTIEARAAEGAFFAKTHPWSTSTHQNRFGTTSLIRNLSKLLTQVIDDVLPKLQGEVTAQLARCSAELDRLPQQITTEPSAFVLSLVTAFCTDVRAYVQGGPRTATLVQKNRGVYGAFKRAIRGTAPPFVPYRSAEEADPDCARFLELDEEADEEREGMERPKFMYLNDVRQFIRQSITRELPNNVPYPAKVALIQAFQGQWDRHSHACFDSVEAEFQRTLYHVIQEKFERYENLKSRVGLVIRELFKHRRDATLIYIQSLLKLETTPFTQNDHYLADKTAKSLARYKDARGGKGTAEKVKPATGFLGFSTPSTNRFAAFVDPPISSLPHPLVSSRSSTATPPTATPPEKEPAKFTFGPFTDGNGSSIFGQPATTSSITSIFGDAKVTESSSGGAFGEPGSSRVASTQDTYLASSTAAEPAVQTEEPTPTSPFGGLGFKSITNAFGVLADPQRQAATGKAGKNSENGSAASNPLFPPSYKQLALESTSSGTRAPSVAQESSSSPFAFPASAPSLGQLLMQSGNNPDDVRAALAALAKVGYTVSESDLGKLNPPDEYEEELQVMAEVRAYFQVAYKRVIDYVPLSIDHLFLYAFSDDLQAFLLNKLGLGAPNATARCQAYLSEDPSVVAEREELTSKKRRLENVQVELFNFGL